MRFSQYLITTSKEASREADCVSHQLMLRAGLIMKFAAGIYSYLPMGYRVLARVTSIIEEEMERIGAQRLLLPFVQPAELWKKSGRWESWGEELVRFKDRKGADFVLGPTHEEVITQLMKKQTSSYKKLPVIVYQIQAKFRDEPRARGGVIRAREFLMKDAYSFCQSEEEAKVIYEKMKEAYKRVFSRCLLDYRLVEADTGTMGGKFSHEFIILTDSGEDRIVECKKCGYVAKLEKAVCVSDGTEKGEGQPVKEVSTPGIRTIKELSHFLGCQEKKILKTIFYETDKGLVAVLVRGDHHVNEEKLRLLIKAKELKLASDNLTREETGVEVGFVGPVGLDRNKLVVDNTVMQGKNFVAGANKKDVHLVNVNPNRDFEPILTGDIRFLVSGDGCPLCRNKIKIKRGIELGQIFHLGERYSSSLGATFLDKMGKEKYFIMGCYGIGVSRLLAAVIEQGDLSSFKKSRNRYIMG
jgi:prolyl-tRNA synthetase